MSEVRKLGEAAGHFSNVDNVSSDLFNRMTGDAHGMSVLPAIPSEPQEPFSEVDNVSSQIFDRMEAIEQPDQMMELPPNATPLFGRDGSAGKNIQNNGGVAPEGWVLVRADKVGALDAVSDPSPSASQTENESRPNPNRADVTYKAAQRRSQLPEGAEPLEGAPAPVNEDSMLASIRKLMVEQKRDFNKKAFPELEPVYTPPPSEPDNAEDGYMEKVEEFEELEQSKFKSALVKFVKTDIVLSICLSVWVSLLLMIFIEPQLSQALAVISLILLGVFRLMQPSRRKRKVVRVVRRKPSNDDLALEDAILCQQA